MHTKGRKRRTGVQAIFTGDYIAVSIANYQNSSGHGTASIPNACHLDGPDCTGRPSGRRSIRL
jgi:hypothetical protein